MVENAGLLIATLGVYMAVCLGLGFVAHIVFSTPLGLLSIAGTIAAFVYLLDVRPAVASLTRRR